MKTIRTQYGYLGVFVLVAGASLVCETVRLYLAPTNMVMVYLLAVVLAAIRLGLRPAIVTAFLSVLAFDVFFVPPRFSFRVSDTEYLVTFFALFIVGVVISTLVARIQDQIEQVRKQEKRTSSLYYLTRGLAAATDIPSVVAALQQAVLRNLESRLTVVLARDEALDPLLDSNGTPLEESFSEVARWVLQSGRRAGRGTAAFSNIPYVLFPIKSVGNVIAVMMIEGSMSLQDQNLELVEAFAGQAAMAFERLRLAAQAEEVRVLREKNLLGQALLNSISHDFRTPLVTISGVLDSLAADEQAFDAEQQRTMIMTAAEEAARLNRFVGNLLDMTRLEAGVLSLRLAECDVEDVIGCVVGAVEARLGAHRLMISVESGLPTISVDLALITQALLNLMDNAIQHSPPDKDIAIIARAYDIWVEISVIDNGFGVPSGEEECIFDKFYRIAVPERTGGTGLGLSIAKGIIETHGGKITAFNRPEGGLEVKVRLPSVGPEMPGGAGNA